MQLLSNNNLNKSNNKNKNLLLSQQKSNNNAKIHQNRIKNNSLKKIIQKKQNSKDQKNQKSNSKTKLKTNSKSKLKLKLHTQNNLEVTNRILNTKLINDGANVKTFNSINQTNQKYLIENNKTQNQQNQCFNVIPIQSQQQISKQQLKELSQQLGKNDQNLQEQAKEQRLALQANRKNKVNKEKYQNYQQQQDQDQQYSEDQQSNDDQYSKAQQEQLRKYLNPHQLQILAKIQQSGIDSSKNPQKHYQKIINNLKDQNKKLILSSNLLKQKVQSLHLKQQQKLQKLARQKDKYHPSKQYFVLKKHLNAKYQQLMKWQKKAHKDEYKLAIELKFKDYINRLIELERQSEKLITQLKLEYKMNRKINKQMKIFNKSIFNAFKQTQQMVIQNKDLKKRLNLLKKITHSQEYSEIEIHSYNIDMKDRENKVKQLIKYQKEGGSLLGVRYQDNFQRSVSKTLFRDSLKYLSPFRFASNHNERPIGTQNTRNIRIKTEMSAKISQISIRNINKTAMNNHSKINHIATEAKQHESQTDHQQVKQQLQLNEYLKTADLSKFFNKLPLQLNNISLNRIVKLSHLQKDQFNQFKNKSYQIKKRLQMPKNTIALEKHPNYKRLGSNILYNKQKQILFIKNQILLKNFRNVNEQKIDILIDLVQERQEKQYELQQIRELRQQIRKQNMAARLKEQQQKKRIKEQKIRNYLQNLKQKGIQAFQFLNVAQKLDKNFKEDFIGQIQPNNLDFDDRIFDWNSVNHQIKQITVYSNDMGIIMLQAKYRFNLKSEIQNTKNKKIKQNKQQNQLQYVTERNIKFNANRSYLTEKKVKISTTQLKNNDFISQIKVLYDIQRKFIAKIQLLSKFNVKYEYGNRLLSFPTALQPSFVINKSITNNNENISVQNPNIKFYEFDIKVQKNRTTGLKNNSNNNKKEQIQQYPSFIFGNYRQIDGMLMLSGLGCRINMYQYY